MTSVEREEFLNVSEVDVEEESIREFDFDIERWNYEKENYSFNRVVSNCSPYFFGLSRK